MSVSLSYLNKRLFFFILILLIISCNSLRGASTLVLDYDSFGSQVMVHEVIGNDWWQWLNHSDSTPKKYLVKVVVYRDLSLDEIKVLGQAWPETGLSLFGIFRGYSIFG